MLNISQQEALWLVTEYSKIRNYGKVSNWIDDHVRALQIIKGSWSKPSCNCEYAALGRIANSVYDQYQLEIQAIAYPPQIEVTNDTQGTNTSTTTRSRRVRKEDTGG